MILWVSAVQVSAYEEPEHNFDTGVCNNSCDNNTSGQRGVPWKTCWWFLLHCTPRCVFCFDDVTDWKQFPKKKLKMKSRLQFWPIRSLCAMGSSKILIHAEAAPSAAGLRSSAGQQRVGHHSCPAPVLHQEAPQAVQVSQPHVRHQVWGENGGGSLRLIQVRKSQSI